MFFLSFVKLQVQFLDNNFVFRILGGPLFHSVFVPLGGLRSGQVRWGKNRKQWNEGKKLVKITSFWLCWLLKIV